MSRKYTIEEVREFFKERGYILTSGEYIGAKIKLDCVCPNGHECSISFDKFLRGRRCLCESGRTRLTIENIRGVFKERSCILLSTEYKPGKKLDYICPNGHKHSIRFDHFKRSHGCPKCSNRVSAGEKEVKQFISSLKVGFISNDRKQLTNPSNGYRLELDVWIPGLNKAIEYNGNYWHRDRKYLDDMKANLCKQQGIDLLIITDKELMSLPN